MTVTDIIKDDNVYKGKWKVKEAEVDKKIKAYNENQRRFLYYPWGVFVTAYARRNLWYGITAVGKDYIYSDTDSIKLKNYDKHKKFFTQYNKMITKKVERMCKHHDIDPKRFAPKTIEGKKKPIGVWELDGHYSKFKTLGAKRYIVEHAESKEIELTVSGLGKDEGVNYLRKKYGSNEEILKNFDDDLSIPAEETGKMVHTYIDHEYVFSIKDYNGVEENVIAKSGVYLEQETFNLGMTQEYIDFIDKLENGYVYLGQKRLS